MLSLAVAAELGAAMAHTLYLLNPIIFLDLEGETERPLHLQTTSLFISGFFGSADKLPKLPMLI